MRSLIDIVDLTVEEIDDLIATANDIIANPDKYAEKCHRKKLATLFFEPSTRTRLSFEAAMLELGGRCKQQLRLQGRKRFRYSACGWLLCRYHRHAPSQRGRTYDCIHALSGTYHQCRGRRT